MLKCLALGGEAGEAMKLSPGNVREAWAPSSAYLPPNVRRPATTTWRLPTPPTVLCVDAWCSQ